MTDIFPRAKLEPLDEWVTISDSAVRHVWRDSAGEEHFIPPTYYEESGTLAELNQLIRDKTEGL